MPVNPADQGTWQSHLVLYNKQSVPLFAEHFLVRWGAVPWNPSPADRAAAGNLYTEIVSRVATQKLSYVDGVEVTALTSIYNLFDRTRAIIEAHEGCRLFESIAWQVLNTHVRPFTAKWHHRSTRGDFAALDSTDEFRAELTTLQPLLSDLADLLAEIRDGLPLPAGEVAKQDPRIRDEIQRRVPIGLTEGGSPHIGVRIADINEAELAAISQRRSAYKLNPDSSDAVALALSGGGIRSATFSLGVLMALSRRNILSQVDYLSSVSGGGYIGAFLAAFLGKEVGTPTLSGQIGLHANQLPFKKDIGEPEAVRHIRHSSRYLLAGNMWARLQLSFAQLYGLVLNLFAIGLIVSAFATFQFWISRSGLEIYLSTIAVGVLASLGGVALLLPLIIRVIPSWRRWADTALAIPATFLLFLVSWKILRLAQDEVGDVTTISGRSIFLAAGVCLLLVAIFTAAGWLVGRLRTMLLLLAMAAVPVFLLGTEIIVFSWLATIDPSQSSLFALCIAGAFVTTFVTVDVNYTSLHRHYRTKLSAAFLIRPTDQSPSGAPFEQVDTVRLSTCTDYRVAPYPLINAALNVPRSRNSAMQGRFTDFFLFSPEFCGSPITGYLSTRSWEDLDPNLDLGTVMAISGAALSPQMGVQTRPGLSFWLALLNVRLGYWLRRPDAHSLSDSPNLIYLLKEMFGRLDENSPFLNVSDGGHIENLGVYELLRRRCKFIIAVDGEQDLQMTFHALTTLQRLAYIDLGVRVDINLDDLRINSQGFSRSHFCFSRVYYPDGSIGYLLYLKASLTGNEGEFLRRYKRDEPDFPHHPTANQFFTEAQFEAYRALGEHIGEKLFIRGIVGDIADSSEVKVAELFVAMGNSLLDPR